MPYWLLALPLQRGRASATWETLQEKTSYGQQLSSNAKLEVPELRVGTIDTLLAHSDDLAKMSAATEAIVAKIRRTIADVAGPTSLGTLRVENLPVESYLTRWRWDEPKFPLRRPIKETLDKITDIMSHLEDDLKVSSRPGEDCCHGQDGVAMAGGGKAQGAAAGRSAIWPHQAARVNQPCCRTVCSQVKVAEYNTVKSQISAALRKAGGSLAVRDIAGVVKPGLVVDSENLVSLFVVVSKYSVKEWESTYEKLCDFVVRTWCCGDLAGSGGTAGSDHWAVLPAVGPRHCLCDCLCVMLCTCAASSEGGAFSSFRDPLSFTSHLPPGRGRV